MTQRARKLVLGLAMLSSGGTTLISCSLGSATNLLTSVNPCGTILACDPRVFRFVNSDINGPGADPASGDVFCTYPPLCTATQDPVFGGLAIPPAP